MQTKPSRCGSATSRLRALQCAGIPPAARSTATFQRWRWTLPTVTAGTIGRICEYAKDDKTINGGQVSQLVDLIEAFHVTSVRVETNGIGKFAPDILRACLKQRKIRCGVGEENAVTNKPKRILEAMEPPLSAGMLWAHSSVINGPLWDQMKDFNPDADQADDYLDASAAAIVAQPTRLMSLAPSEPDYVKRPDWRGRNQEREVEFVRE